jgi:acyl-coenzyme A thioesterase PaaI-like protein
MTIRTHLQIATELAGRPLSVEPGRAVVELVLAQAMAVDERGLVHGGFTFGLADHAAMLAVNEPTVVLGQAQLKLLRPTVVGDRLVAEAVVDRSEGKKRFVRATVRRGDEVVAEAEMVALVPDRHVLDIAPR